MAGEESVADAVAVALASVHDPCSLAFQRPVSIVDLGLVRSCELDEAGRLTIRLGTTSPQCLLLGHIVERIDAAVREIPGVHELDVTFDPEFAWTPEQMSPEATELIAGVRAARSTGAVPQAWRTEDR